MNQRYPGLSATAGCDTCHEERWGDHEVCDELWPAAGSSRTKCFATADAAFADCLKQHGCSGPASSGGLPVIAAGLFVLGAALLIRWSR